MVTYNLRISNSEDSINGNGWHRRYPEIADVIKYHGFSLFGTQEGLRPMLDELKACLPGFEYIGVGCDDGAEAGGHNAIFYQTDDFELLDNGTFWISETPDTVSLGWDGQYRRVCTWGQFRHKASDTAFILFNVHLDHIGVLAREEGAKLILQKIDEISEDLPVILCGDFNDDQSSACYRIISASTRLRDAYQVAVHPYIKASTFNNFDVLGSFYTVTGEYQRIDHIFISPEFTLRKYGVLTDTYHSRNLDGTSEVRLPSDHYPVKILIQL